MKTRIRIRMNVSVIGYTTFGSFRDLPLAGLISLGRRRTNLTLVLVLILIQAMDRVELEGFLAL